MSRLTRDGAAEPVSRDEILRRERGRPVLQLVTSKPFIFPVQLTASRIGHITRLILIFAICDDYTYICYTVQ